MTAINDVTGDRIKTKQSTEDFRNGYDRIFGRKHGPVELGQVSSDGGGDRQVTGTGEVRPVGNGSDGNRDSIDK